MSLFRAFGLFLLQIPLILIGIVVVAVLIPFRKTDETTKKLFTEYPIGGYWEFSNFGTWWGNPFDGLLGDKRGWWDNECRKKERTCRNYFSMWLWAAVRNPVNYFSRCVAGVDVSRCVITKLAGKDVVEADTGLPGWQYLLATRDDGKQYHRFFTEIPYPFSKRHMLMIDIGWKIKLSHNGTTPDARPQDRFKGDVFTISLWKSV